MLLERPLPGGYEEKIETCYWSAHFQEGMRRRLKHVMEQPRATLLNALAMAVSVIHKPEKAKRRHLFVTTRGRDVGALKVEIVNSLRNFLCDHLGSDEANSNLSLAEQFKALSCISLKSGDATDDEIQRAYAGIVPDHDGRVFFSAYRELVTVLQTSRTTTLQDILKISLANEDWRTVSIATARVVAAKPHSCDDERLVSAFNDLKDNDRSSLAADTLDAYLHVHVNMPVLSEFDVRPAVHTWFSSAIRRPHSCKKATDQCWFADVFTQCESP